MRTLLAFLTIAALIGCSKSPDKAPDQKSSQTYVVPNKPAYVDPNAPPQPTESTGTKIGRYQLAVSNNGGYFLVDTATGQCWSGTGGNGQWVHEMPPLQNNVAERSVQKRKIKKEFPLKN